MPRIQSRISPINKHGAKLARRPGKRALSEQDVQPGSQKFNKEHKPATSADEVELQQLDQRTARETASEVEEEEHIHRVLILTCFHNIYFTLLKV